MLNVQGRVTNTILQLFPSSDGLCALFILDNFRGVVGLAMLTQVLKFSGRITHVDG